VAEEIGEVERSFTGSIYLFCSLLQVGDVEGAKGVLRAMPRYGDELQEPTYRWGSVCMEAALALFEGRFDAAEELIPQAYEVGVHAISFNAVSSHALQRFLLHRERGGLERWEGELRACAAETPTYYILRSALANLHLQLGDRDTAAAILAELARNDFEQVYYDEEFLASMTLLAEVCAALEDADTAATIYERLLPHRERNAFAMIEFAVGSVARPLGLLARVLGRVDEAVEHLERALEMNARMGARPWAAHTSRDLALILVRAGDPATERPAALLDKALAEYRALGMTPWVRRAEEELEERGLQPATPEP
jgi:tetratricopeptide (TPR) repeat protein